MENKENDVKRKWVDEAVARHLAWRRNDYITHGPKVRLLIMHHVMHALLLPCLKIDRKISKSKIEIVNDQREATNKPFIYACTHIGGRDVESAFEAIKSHAWILLGDPNDFYLNATGGLLYLNGVISVETRNKQDRYIAKERCIELLKHKQSLLMFPEGAWNISTNKLVYYLYYGAVEMAILSGAEIVPVAINHDAETYYVNIGKNLDYTGHQVTESRELTQELRDHMATLQWQNIEKGIPCKRSAFSDDCEKEYLKTFEDCAAGYDYAYSIQDIIDTRFNPRDITELDEAFEFMNSVEPSINNAVLYRNR